MSRTELATMLGLPKSTVVGVVDDLIARGLVSEGAPQAQRTVGRPAKVLSLAGPRRVVGVAVWSLGTLRVGIADPHGELLAVTAEDLDHRAGHAGIVDPAIGRLDALLAELALDRSSLNGVVLGVPAPLQRGLGRPHSRAEESLPAVWAQWLDHDPSGEVESRLGVPAVVENDANLGALGEGAFGAARGLDSFVYVKIGDGCVGAGLVLGGRLHRGVAGFAGELAHVQVYEDGPLCHCGGRGCLMGRLDATLLQASHPSYEHPPPFEDLLTLAEQGAAGPRRILVDLGRTLGRPLADLCTLLNPAAVVIDGSLGPSGSHVIDGVRQAIDRHSAPVAADSTVVTSGALGDRADLLGGVVLARNESLAAVAI
jgi:predicted NBD/HSP70 family sugar kinase